MPEGKINKGNTKVLSILESLLFLSKSEKKDKDKNPKNIEEPEDIRTKVLLKIERAEIMSAMIAMRSGEQNEDNSQNLS